MPPTYPTYWAEEFGGKSKPEDYRTKIPLTQIEQGLRQVLHKLGIADKDIRTQEMGNYWRQTGKDFLIGKKFDLTLSSFQQVDAILKEINTRGIESMYLDELKNKNAAEHRKQGKINALKAAREKAEYLVQSMGKKLGDVLRITENSTESHFSNSFNRQVQSNVSVGNAGEQEYRILKWRYEMTARFAIAD